MVDRGGHFFVILAELKLPLVHCSCNFLRTSHRVNVPLKIYKCCQLQ
jgi:hypothetical protein